MNAFIMDKIMKALVARYPERKESAIGHMAEFLIFSKEEQVAVIISSRN